MHTPMHEKFELLCLGRDPLLARNALLVSSEMPSAPLAALLLCSAVAAGRSHASTEPDRWGSPASAELDRLERVVARLERSLQPRSLGRAAEPPTLRFRLDAARALFHPRSERPPPLADLERNDGDGDSDASSEDPTSAEALSRETKEGMPSQDKARLVRRVVGVVHDTMKASPDISDDCRQATMRKIRNLQSLTSDVTGEVADQAYAAHKKEQKAAWHKERKLASTLLGWRMDAGDAYQNFYESQWGKPADFLKKRADLAHEANERLPGAFDDFYRWTTTHPELRPIIGGNLHQGLPKQLDMSDMTAVPTADDILASS